MIGADKVGTTLRYLVQKYSESYRNPNLAAFIVCEPHTMTSWYATPEASKPGCYVFYSATGEILYVGKASLTSDMGARIAAHDYQKPRSAWREQAAFVQFVIVPEAFESPSLEEFLINELRPTGNIRGRPLTTSE
ncbi:GIY-YIG nuclease family protein [Methylocystis sp. S23]